MPFETVTRRQFLAAPLATAAARSMWAATPRQRMRSLDGSGRVWDIWRNPGRFTKNPDIVRFPSGRMMLVFCDDDQHWAEESSRITTLECTDDGKTWSNPKVIADANIQEGEERWVTPRMSRLKNGRLVIICDHDDYHHYHEDRPSGIWIWFSDDEGKSWSRPKLTGVPGIEPGRVTELPDGTLLINAHMVFRDNFKLAEFVMRSTDGLMWKDLSVIAKDRVHNYCEGHILPHSSGTMACILRENNHSGYPSYVSFSHDSGFTWTRPQPLPFAGDRPFGGELPDGRVLITYRNQAGNAGTQAWLGDLFAGEGYQVSAVRYGDQLSFEDGALHIYDRPGAETRYLLMPPEGLRSDIVMEAQLRVDGPMDKAIATFNVSRLGLTLHVFRDRIGCDFRRGAMMNPAHPDLPRVDTTHRVNMTAEHRLRLQTSKGRMWVAVDGEPVIHGVMIKEWPLEDTWFGRGRNSAGAVWIRSAHYESINETEPAFSWSWTANSGRLPDQYQIDRMLEINPNPLAPDKQPDNGYSSWLRLPGGDILLVDYTNRGDPRPTGHLYAARFSLEDFING